jgi:hypothetical protein
MNQAILLLAGGLVSLFAVPAAAASKHSPSSRFPTYEGRVMCGYQGWFRAEGDGSGRGWVHYARGKFTPNDCTVDLWPDVSEYEKTYPTGFKLEDGSPARVFSSWDESTVDLHFRWMREYGIDGVFMQRFFDVTRTEESRAEGRVILGHALKAAKKHGRAVAVMYDLSGLKPGEDCASLIQDWKELVDELKITSQGADQPYLYHRGRPLVTIWGIGFPDRPYNIRNIGLERLLDFLKNDPRIRRLQRDAWRAQLFPRSARGHHCGSVPARDHGQGRCHHALDGWPLLRIVVWGNEPLRRADRRGSGVVRGPQTGLRSLRLSRVQLVQSVEEQGSARCHSAAEGALLLGPDDDGHRVRCEDDLCGDVR